MFPESNRKDSPVPVTHYQRPGLKPVVVPGSSGVGRCLYRASNGDAYCVIGTTVYFIDSAFALHSIGDISGYDVSSTTPVSMIDNGTTLLIVAGRLGAGNMGALIDFAANPTAGDTITLNSVVWTFVSGATSGTNVHIESTLALTMLGLVTALRASVDPLITQAYYYSGADATTGRYLYVISKTSGPLATSYVVAASAATVTQMAYGVYAPNPGPGWTTTLGVITAASIVPISDVAWTGADRADYIDTFVIWNQPGSRNFGSTLSNQITPLDATYVAGKTGYPDPLQSIIVCKRQIILPGSLKGEVWYDAGNPLFPFAELQGSNIEHGIVARYSIASSDENVYWLSRDLQGQGYVLKHAGTQTTRISNFALEYQIRLMYQNGGTIADAVAYTYQIDGHSFYVLSFPTGNQTWVYDDSVGDPELAWSQRAWIDSNGGVNRDRGVLGAHIYSKNCVIDWENGTIYEQSMTTYVDRVNAQDYPILYLRTFPHLMTGIDPASGSPVLGEGKMIQHDRFQLDATVGTGPAGPSGGSPPAFSLRWSDDRGQSWGNPVKLLAGEQGKFGTRPDQRNLGQAMDRVYEVSWSFSGEVALNGAWVEGRVLNQ